VAVLTESPEHLNRVHRGHIPFVRFLLALLFGIGIGYAVVPQRPLYVVAWGILAVVLTAFMTIRCVTRLRERRYYGLMGVLILFAWSIVGCLLTWQTDPEIDRSHFSRVESKALVGYVIDEPVVRGNHSRFPFAVTQAYGDHGLLDVTGRLMLTINVGDCLSFNYGDELLIPITYEKVPPPYNPGELDYRSFLAGKDMWHQGYLQEGEVTKTGSGKGNPIVAYALTLRKRMVAKFSAYIPDRDAYSVASALILGYRAEMSDTLVQAFSNTGTIHVLSVSGMHVVLVFWLLAKLLWWMDRSRSLRVAKFVLLLLAVWGYALLTGFSPPVLRASIMVSFVMAGTIFGQENRIYNSIAASAFFLLLYHPKFIVDIGFQLSYLAVLGIVFLHPVFRHLFPVSNRLARPVVDYVGMSVGAQAGAGPLAAYYFHQFPLYFLPANLFIVLPASCIMYIGFALLLLPSGQLASWVGMVLEWLILVTNTTLGYIERLPMASLRGIWLAWWEPMLVYVLIVAVAMAVAARKKRWVYAALGCATLLVCSSLSAVFEGVNRQGIIVFNVRRDMVIGLIGEKEAWLYTNLPSMDDRTIGYSVLPIMERHVPIDAIHVMPQDSTYHDQWVYAKGGLLQFGNRRLMVYDGTVTYDGHLKVDVVILRNNPSGPLAELLETVDCKQLVLDGSNYDSTINRWVAEAKAADIPLYVLKDNFAYVWGVESPVP